VSLTRGKVLIGFIATGYICWVILVLHYLVEYKPDQGGFCEHINPIDREILGYFRKCTGAFSPRWAAGLEKVITIQYPFLSRQI
jgi:hypothetical protein